NAMEQVLEGPSVYSSKSAVVLSQENFTTNLNGFNNYFVLTNLDYRTFQESLGLLKFLVSLENKDLKSFADKLSQSRLFMTTLFQTPNEKGELPSSSYGRPDYTFKGNTYILHIRRSESES